MKKYKLTIYVLCAILAGFALAAILIALTQNFYQEKEQQDGRIQDIIIRGKLYNCEEVN